MQEKNELPEPEEQSKIASGSQHQVLKMGKLLVFPCCMICEPPELWHLCAYYYFIGFLSPRFVQSLFEPTWILWQEVSQFMHLFCFNVAFIIGIHFLPVSQS